MSEKTYDFVGLGNMGQPLAGNLVKAGYQLAVYDTNSDAVAALAVAGARPATSLQELGSIADIVFLSLPTPAAVEAVCSDESGLGSATRTQIIVDLSTTGPAVEEQLAARLAAKGKTLIDCPVSGGPAGAREGRLALMAAGDATALTAVEPALKVFGTPYVVGDRPGMGQSMKVINNLVSTTALAITSEALVLGVKSGLDPDTMINVLNAGSGRNSATMAKAPQNILPRTFDFGFAIGLSAKDAGLCLDEAARLGVPMKVGKVVRQMLEATRDQLGFDADMTTLIKLIEKEAGVKVRGAAADKDS